MPRKLPPSHPKGAPRKPGSGRKKGTPNRRTVELRALMAALLNDVDYQHRLRHDFRKRRVHQYGGVGVTVRRRQAYGEDRESANVTMEKKLAEEREVLSKLSLEQLEELAAESQALVDKAMANGVKPAPRRLAARRRRTARAATCQA